MMDDRARLQLLSRKIAQIRLNNEEFALPTFQDNNKEIILKKAEMFEDIKPLYCSPSDFIDEFGRFKGLTHSTGNDVISPEPVGTDFDMPRHLQTEGPFAIEKIRNYMKKRFPERLLQIRGLSATSEKVFTAWRGRTRRREAEWGDPEDLGKISNDPRPEEIKIAPEIRQIAVETKFLLPSFFIPNLSNRLYNSNRPTLHPIAPFSHFNANTAVWSPSERKTFIELYLQHPKNFGRISAHLPFKSCEQCVEFYYRHKKEYKLKQMVASYRKAMVAQRKLILNTTGSNSNSILTNNLGNMNILPMSQNNIPSNSINNTIYNTNSINSNLMFVDDDSNSNSNNNNNNNFTSINSTNSSRKKTGRPVGRPKSKDKQ